MQGENGHSVKPTSGKTWRRAREVGFMIQLPSGNLARVRPVSPEQMLEMGEIPDILTPLIEKMLFDGADADDVTAAIEEAIDPGATFEPNNMLRLIKFVNAFCVHALVDPRIVEAPKADDEIAITDLELPDRFAVYQYCTQPVEVLHRFHLVATQALESVSEGNQNGDPAVEHSGDSE